MNEEALGEASSGATTVVLGLDMIMDDNRPHQTVLFADVSGSVKLHEKLGDTEALRAVERCMKRMERAVEAFNGRILLQKGDELMALFEATDEASLAAVEMQQRVADLPPVSGVKLAIRVGFSHGVTEEDDEESLTGETVSMAAYLAGLAKPGQILTNAQAQSALSPSLQLTTRDLGPLPAKGNFPGMQVFELVTLDLPLMEAAAEAVPDTGNNDVSHGSRLRLRYGKELVILDKRTHVISMGRDADCDIVIRDRRASRHHVFIEWREGSKFVLSDKSTNGTFVTLNGHPEMLLRKEECIIHGKGTICFAASANSPEADVVEFEQF